MFSLTISFCWLHIICWMFLFSLSLYLGRCDTSVCSWCCWFGIFTEQRSGHQGAWWRRCHLSRRRLRRWHRLVLRRFLGWCKTGSGQALYGTLHIGTTTSGVGALWSFRSRRDRSYGLYRSVTNHQAVCTYYITGWIDFKCGLRLEISSVIMRWWGISNIDMVTHIQWPSLVWKWVD
jgi:hypothetical protein